MNILSGRIEKINLSTCTIESESSSKYFKQTIGGRGLNQYLLFNELSPGTAPFDQSNVIIFGAGILVGTGVPGAVRLNIDSLNVLTGGIGSCNCGGNFAPEMRFAGIDNLVIKGRSKKPIYLFIDDGKIEFKDAEHIWGKRIKETDKIIKEEIKDNKVQILSIGPAGENLVRSACIMVNKARAAARCGLGAIMGSKNLKAIVVRGSGNVEVNNKPLFKNKVKELNNKIKNNEFQQTRMKYGVYCYNDPWYSYESPYRNFQGGKIPELVNDKKVQRDAFLSYLKKTKGCNSSRNSNCPISCWGVYEFQDENNTFVTEALQGNDPHNFGAKLNIFNTKNVLKGHELCNELGLDQDNSCGTLAWAFECYQRGILTTKETDGLKLEWGNDEVVFELLEKMASREGFGDILAEGSKRAAELLGGSSYSINIKGQDLFESIRADIGWALGTSVAARGGTHTRGAVLSSRLQNITREKSKELFGFSDIESLSSYKNQEKIVFYFERLEAMLDSLGVCNFTNAKRINTLQADDFAQIFSAATDFKISKSEFLNLGERIHTLEKCFNVLHRGWTRIHDNPPERFFKEPVVNGPKKGEKLDKKEWDKLLDRYYQIHGWDEKTGWPFKDRLLELGLDNVVNKLEEYNRLP